MVAKGFQTVVNRGELWLAAGTEDGVIVPYDGQFIRDGQAFFVGKFDGADGKVVVGSHNSPVRDSGVHC